MRFGGKKAAFKVVLISVLNLTKTFPSHGKCSYTGHFWETKCDLLSDKLLGFLGQNSVDHMVSKFILKKHTPHNLSCTSHSYKFNSSQTETSCSAIGEHLLQNLSWQMNIMKTNTRPLPMGTLPFVYQLLRPLM